MTPVGVAVRTISGASGSCVGGSRSSGVSAPVGAPPSRWCGATSGSSHPSFLGLEHVVRRGSAADRRSRPPGRPRNGGENRAGEPATHTKAGCAKKGRPTERPL